MKSIYIEDSYKIWNQDNMWYAINDFCKANDIHDPQFYLNRSYTSMFIEWYVHNIGYYLTFPFVKIKKVKEINERFKHIKLEEHKNEYV